MRMGSAAQAPPCVTLPPYAAAQVPQPVALPEAVTAVAAGHYHTLCLAESGDVWAFGRNTSGELGLGKGGAGEERLPRRVEALAGASYTP